MENRQPWTPKQPGETKKPRPEAPASDEGLFGRWRKKSEKTERSKTAHPEASAEAPKRPGKTRRQKMGEGILGFLRGEQRAPTGNRAERPTAEKPQARAESEPVYEQASRMRRFARVVINHVMGVANEENQRASRSSERGQPLNTEPLVDAADDLRDAADDLGDAAEASFAQEASEPSSPDYGGQYEQPPQPERPKASSESSPFEPRIADHVQQRIQNLERKLEAEKEKSTVIAAAATAGLGIMAVAGVLLMGHEYLVHKKIRKEQRGLKRELRQQQIRHETDFARLQREQTADMGRRDRQAYYERLSTFTHKQAATTRAAAQEIRRVQPPQRVEAAPTRPQSEQQFQTEPAATPNPREQRRPEQSPQQRSAPEWQLPRTERHEQAKPLVQVETADTIEHSPNQPQFSANSSAGGGAASGRDATQPRVTAQLKVPQSPPLSPAALREQAQRKARIARLASNAWLYSLALIAVVGIVLAVIFLH